MADVAALGLAVDSSQVVSAESALDRLGATAGRTQGRVSAIATASEALVSALNRNTSATAALSERMAGVEAATARAAAGMRTVSTESAQAATNVVKFTGASAQTTTQLNSMGGAADKTTTSWRALGNEASDALRKISAARAAVANMPAVPRAAPPSPPSGGGGSGPAPGAAGGAANPWARLGPAGAAQTAMLTPEGMAAFRLSNLSGNGQIPLSPGQAANRNGRLNSYQAQNLFYQGTDVIASAASGISPLTIALQQGGQIAPTFMGRDGASLGGVAAQVGDAAKALASRISPLVGVFGAVAGAAALAVSAQSSYAETQRALFRQTSVGAARGSGATPEAINAIAANVGGVFGISTREARSGAGELAATGRISPEIIARLTGTAKDYAATTGQELPDAFGSLAAAFADPTKGADSLNKQLGFLNDTTRENIQRLDAQGNRLGAQTALFNAYNTSLTKSSELTTGWGRVTGAAANVVSEAWDKLGQGVDKLFTGGTLEDRLADAERVAARRKQIGSYLPFGGDAVGNSLDDDVKSLRAQISARDEASRKTAANQRSQEVDTILKSLNPSSEALKRLDDQAANIRRPFTENWIDPFGQAKAAIDGIAATTKQMKEDMAAGGAQYADSLRSAQFGLKTAGFDSGARSAAQIDEDAANKRIAALRSAATDTDTGAYDKAMQSIETERQLRQQAFQKEAVTGAGNTGGAFSRAPANIQVMILDASKQTGVDPAILAAVGEKENAFGLTGATKVLNKQGRPATTAYGFGQITDGAETDIRKEIPGYSKYDPATAVLGTATYLRQRIAQAGSTIAGLDGYGTGAGYGVDVLRRAGKLGDASQEGVAKDLDAQAQASKRMAEAARINAEYYGKSGLQLQANTQAAEQYQAALARGVPPSDALKQSLLGYATAAETAARATKLVQFRSDDAFAREQLGRDRTDQSAFSAARGRFGDTSSPEALEVIRATRETANLTEAKQLITDGATSFVSEFRRTGDAAKALSNAFGSAADKLLSKALDSAISSGFSALTGSGGGGLGSLFGGGGKGGIDVGLNFLGFASGGYTGHGGKYEPAGVVHRGEYVFDSAAVSRIGVSALEAYRHGLPGYTDGGYVGGMPANSNNSTSTDNSLSIGQLNLQGSSGDPATDDAYLDKAMGRLRQEMGNVFEQKQAMSLRTNGALWKAGVRRSA